MHISDWSDEKNTVVRGVFAWLITVGKAQMQKWPNSYPCYHYIDMNAADGSGSPSLFVNAVERACIPYRASFIEMNRRHYAQLMTAYQHNPLITTYHGDHNSIVPDCCQRISGKPYGIIYNDPHGIPSFETLAAISRMPQTAHIDFLINCPATAIKRARGSSKKPIYLIDGIDGINKQYWVIRAPSGCWQWTILLGTNWSEVQEWRAQQFYRIDSSAGQDILYRLNLTTSEREINEQSRLPLL